ncbi:hypothetical protein MHZ92_03205 [Sporosarcina sp. ACRSL]|uniref:DUF6612 family protein n=1 Tax=Sporosarcina sp. ACRSL TaxID=2918215 RepID=UPI001EF5162C|nr:DUF6612 family protein [Sporosarcina sp. ACRSL]MCG7343125.1 hypothetical protein [Sporosarcina sp. ACRSL]
MKKWLKGLGVGVLALGLAACGSEAEPKKDEATGEKVELTNKSEMTAEEVYNKAMEVSAEQKSMHAVMDIDQKISMAGQELEMDSKIKMDMDVIVEPLAMYQKMNMDMGDMGSMDMEMYMNESGFYMNDPESGQWVKLPNDLYEEMMAGMGGETDPTLDMNLFKEFKEDFKFEQTDDEYILTLAASGDKFSGLMKELMGSALPADMEMSDEEAEILNNMDVKSLNVVINIDKETFYTNAFDLDMDMTMKIEEEEMRIVQKMKSVITKINEIDEIVIPQEVIDEAVDLEEMMQGQEG